MLSEKRLAANRQNAQQSTGPRTAQGKSQSRQNSLKHGLTGYGDVMPVDVAGEVAAREAEFAASAQPANVFEHTLIRRMALASVRMEVAERVENARRKERRRRTVRRWENAITRSADAGIEVLQRKPAEGLEQLESTSAGCRWLIGQWNILEQAITPNGFWAANDLTRALALLGFKPHQGFDEAFQVRVCYLALKPELDVAEAVRVLNVDMSSVPEEARQADFAKMLPEKDQARRLLQSLIRSQVERLEQLCEEVEAELERPDLADRLEAAEVDSSLDGMRLARYDAMCEMSFHRNWKELVRLRKMGPAVLGVQPAEAIAASAQNEPICEPSSPDATGICESSPERTQGVAEAVAEASTRDARPAEAVPPPFEPAAPAFEAPALAANSA